jgi:plastocyanin
MPSRSIPTALAVVALALAACSPAASTPPVTSVSSSALPADTAAITVMDFRLSTPVLTATGPTVSFTVTNDGPTPHNVAVRDANGNVLMTTRDLSRGESQTISAEIPPGTYVTFCSLPGHESLGVKGTLTVTSP